jgi:hypothetical protein
MNNSETFASDIKIENEIKCSSCGKELISHEDTNGWHRFSVSQSDNNSIYFDVCSLECYLNQVRESVKELEYSENGKIDGLDVSFIKKMLPFMED